MKLFTNEGINFDETNSLRTQLTVARMYGFIITVLSCIMAISFMTQNNEFVNKEIKMTMEYNNLKKNYDYIESNLKSMSNTINELTKISEELDFQNQKLVESNQQYFEELSTLRKRTELYDKYEYALIDKSGKRTDITYDQLVTLKTLVKESKIPDEDLILAWIMTESNGIETAKNETSTAKGYGQFLDGTSRFVYTSLLNKSGWNSSVALDGNTNIEMMVAYIDYLYEKNNGDLYQIMKDYRGKQDISGYVSKIDSYLAKANKSVKDIYLICSGK